MVSNNPKNIDNLIQDGYSIDIGRYISRGWEICQKNLGGFIGFFIIFILISLAVGLLPKDLRPVGNAISSVISGPLTAGFFIVAFKLIKQQATTFGDFFRGFDNFLQFFLLSLVMGLLVLLGFLLLIIPGIYLAVAYTFALPLVVERRFDFWTAMETSRKLVTKQWFSFFGFGLLLFLINFAGALLCGLGLLITVPLTYCAIAAAYEDVLGVSLSASSVIEDQLG